MKEMFVFSLGLQNQLYPTTLADHIFWIQTTTMDQDVVCLPIFKDVVEGLLEGDAALYVSRRRLPSLPGNRA